MTEVNKKNWPEKAVVTAGMPYGNKALHFGHVGGVFVPADCFARYLKDRIGPENVRFISGTDCFGSPIDEGFRKLKEAGKHDGTIEEYVESNHNAQVDTLNKYDVDLSIFEGSGIGLSGKKHQELTDKVLTTLKDNGWLHCEDSKQFYDTQAHMFLNGRQVHGRCPVQGCKSEEAYADECSLGHQYAPEDLIAPKSNVTGTVPEMRTVKNWYFDLPKYREFLQNHVDKMRQDKDMREIVPRNIEEFLTAPIIFVKNECFDDYEKVKNQLPQHTYKPAEGNKQSFTIEFDTIYDRDDAKDVLNKAGIRFRTGKTLVPFRLTGNAAWGVKSPDLSGDGSETDMTIWCWPESLWAPISFTMAANEQIDGANDGNDDRNGNGSGADESWKDFWSNENAVVYQFIGQDNIYFYGVAQPALFDALQNDVDGNHVDNDFSGLEQTRLVANHHVLFGKTKASSSGAVKPPSADELLNYYTPEQLRAHWLALGLAQKSVGFSPKPFDPDEKKRTDSRVADPVLKEGALLTNVFNRLARSCFYEAKNNFDSTVELLQPTDGALELVKDAVNRYENLMYKVELYSVMQLMDEFIRNANKWWTDGIAAASKEELAEGIDVRNGGEPSQHRKQVLADSFYLLYVVTLMMHPVVPSGCEKICKYMNFDPKLFFNWEQFYKGLESENVWQGISEEKVHKIEELPPRFDFFRKHESQYKKR